VGALPSEVMVMNALTINIHLLLWGFYRPTPERFHFMIEEESFPSDAVCMSFLMSSGDRGTSLLADSLLGVPACSMLSSRIYDYEGMILTRQL